MSFVIFDVVILILLLLTAWKGYRRGFVLTLCSLLAVFVAFIGATVISSQLARPMSRLIQPALERSITQVLEEQTHAVLPPPETSEASQPPALSDAFSGEEGQEGEEDWGSPSSPWTRSWTPFRPPACTSTLSSPSRTPSRMG